MAESGGPYIGSVRVPSGGNAAFAFDQTATSDQARAMKLVLANPGVGPFVQQTARALLEADLLASFWTTFADQPEARWRRALVRIVSAAGINIERELQRRAVNLPSSVLRLAPGWEVV